MMESQDLRNVGLKVTLPRLKILEILENNAMRHMSAEDVYKLLIKEDADIGLATIYRVLTQFEQAGLVKRHHFEGGHAVFELERGEHHDHMVDIESGKVVEFVSPEIEKLQHDIAEAHGYEIVGHSLVIYVKASNTGKPGKSR
ncbi:MAG: ferric iron uptake transcriptional regulator [Stagnimonas sp.]|nr:ferric iron uptake transcriptional regulator [Stagnimonas sp.]